MRKSSFIWVLALTSLAACQDDSATADAYGNFEASEVIISSEGAGPLLFFNVEEGQLLEAGQLVGLIDTVPLHLKREQLRAGIRAITDKTQGIEPQIKVLEEQKRNLLREEKRLVALVADSAATPKQLDDIRGQIEVVSRQVAASRSQNKELNEGILAELAPLEAQIRQVDDQIRRCYIVNPVAGTVLLKLAEAHEIASPGKPLYTIASLDELELRAYISGEQLPHLRIGQEVDVLIDDDAASNRRLPGVVSWISSQSEFTPKTIQTKEERVNLVYAIKVRVANDGALKIGMPGEVAFQNKGQDNQEE